MGCCNEKRARWSKAVGQLGATSVASQTSTPSARELPLMRTVKFEYMGETALSVLGPVTRTRYRFGSTGAQLGVDHRDVPYVSAVPNLRRLREA